MGCNIKNIKVFKVFKLIKKLLSVGATTHVDFEERSRTEGSVVRAEWCLPPTRLGKWSEAVSAPKPTPSIEATRVDGGCVVYRLPVQEHPRLGVFLGHVIRGQEEPAGV